MASKEEREMTVEENKAIVRRLWEEVNKGNVSVLDELCAADFVWHAPGGLERHDLQIAKKVITRFFTTFPDFHVTIEDLIAKGDKVVTRSTRTGTHQGEYRGIAATGNKVTWTFISIYRIEGGKIVEEWDEGDHLSLMQQMGAILTPGQG